MQCSGGIDACFFCFLLFEQFALRTIFSFSVESAGFLLRMGALPAIVRQPSLFGVYRRQQSDLEIVIEIFLNSLFGLVFLWRVSSVEPRRTAVFDSLFGLLFPVSVR